jgi:hypothetical protein
MRRTSPEVPVPILFTVSLIVLATMAPTVPMNASSELVGT